MKRILLTVSAVFLFAGFAFADSMLITINAVDANGVGKALGTVRVEDTDKGLSLRVALTGIPAGAHGFHVHEFANCGNAAPDGKTTGAALAAGGHYDPDKSGKHMGPNGKGHLGDLPFITADANGIIKEMVLAPRLKVSDLKGRSLMIHAGGDNYSDSPAALGGGGARIACGVIK